MHKTLERQLIRIYGKGKHPSLESQKLFEVVSKTYSDYDNDRKLIERSLEISSSELTESNERLREEKKEVEKRVTERTRELSQERSKLEKVAQNMKMGAILVDHTGQVVFVNDEVRTFINFNDDGYDGVLKSLYETFSDYPISQYVERCLQGETLEIKDVEVKQSIYDLLFQVLPDDHGPAGFLIWIWDVTSEKLLERSKSELVAVASHQLRTPLTVTKGNTEMLLDESFGTLNGEQKEILTQTAESNENMIALVNQMLDITKIEQGKLAFKVTDVHVDTILERAVSDLTSYAEEKHVTIKYNAPNEEIPEIRGDETRLYQVFQNLIENGIKYCRSEEEECLVEISLGVSDAMVRIVVQDYGIGIPTQEQGKIFERFYRASNAITFVINGTGLGLYIVKSVVEYLHGTISFSSVENKGTIFTITFPIKSDVEH